MAGWVKLNRDITKHWIWEEKPFDKKSAWIDIILMANHSDNKFMLGSELIDIEAGSFITSELKLMERWGWSKTKLRNFLKLLEEDNMIIKKSDKKKTTISVVNYKVYQSSENHTRTTEEPQENHVKTMKELQKDTNNNDKNEKNINNTNAEEIWLAYPNKKGKTKAINKINKLLKTYNKEILLRCIERYKKQMEEDRKTFKDKQYKNGDTFFNNGYEDYLDQNYKCIGEVRNERKIVYGF